jgi:hypothetical protein
MFLNKPSGFGLYIIKRIVIMTICFCYLAIAHGQLKWGLRSSIHLSTTVAPAYTNPYRPAFSLGAFVEKNSLNTIFYLSDIGYSLKGNVAGNGMFNLNYLTAKVLLGYKFNSRVALLAGPEFAYLLQANYKDNTSKVIDKDSFRKTDLGFEGMARYSFNYRWTIAYSYIHGLRPIQKPVVYFDNGFATIGKKDNPKNSLHQLSLLCYFRS